MHSTMILLTLPLMPTVHWNLSCLSWLITAKACSFGMNLYQALFVRCFKHHCMYFVDSTAQIPRPVSLFVYAIKLSFVSFSSRVLWNVERLWEILLGGENNLLISKSKALHLLLSSKDGIGGCHIEGIQCFVGGPFFSWRWQPTNKKRHLAQNRTFWGSCSHLQLPTDASAHPRLVFLHLCSKKVQENWPAPSEYNFLSPGWLQPCRF